MLVARIRFVYGSRERDCSVYIAGFVASGVYLLELLLLQLYRLCIYLGRVPWSASAGRIWLVTVFLVRASLFCLFFFFPFHAML